MQGKRKLCIVVTASLAIRTLYAGQIKYLSDKGYSVTLVASPGAEHGLVAEEGGRSIPIYIERKPHVLKDLIALIRLLVHFVFNRYDLVIVSTPKASLLASVAARLAFQKNILFVVRGRAYEGVRGRKRKLFEFLDEIVCRLSKKVLFISRELMGQYVENNICARDKAIMSSRGSSKGVDVSAFSSAKFSTDTQLALRKKLDVPPEANVFLFCGRLRKDKGIDELCESFKKVDELKPELKSYLILVGQDEYELDPYESRGYLQQASNVKVLGFWDDVSPLFSIANVFVFPSHREGFGNVLIEASAMEIPVLAFDVIGCREAVADGVSGYLCEFPDTDQLAERMDLLAADPILQKRMGMAGRQWVIENFSRDAILLNNLKVYEDLIG